MPCEPFICSSSPSSCLQLARSIATATSSEIRFSRDLPVESKRSSLNLPPETSFTTKTGVCDSMSQSKDSCVTHVSRFKRKSHGASSCMLSVSGMSSCSDGRPEPHGWVHEKNRLRTYILQVCTGQN